MRRTLASLASLLAAGPLACGERTADPCADPGALTLRVERPELTPGQTTAAIAVVASAPLTRLDVRFAPDSESGRVAGVAGGPTDFQISLEGLVPGTTVAVAVEAAAGVAGCPTPITAPPTVVRLEVPERTWRHPEPITVAPLGPRAAPPWFVERTAEVGLDADVGAGRGMLVDFDGDGREDLVTLPVSEDRLSPRFFRNASGPDGVRFEDVTDRSGMADAQMALLVFGDVDGDGDPDAFAGLSFRAAGGEAGIWENVGGGRFEHRGLAGTDPPNRLGGVFREAAAASFADLDGDGHLDLYVGHWYGGQVGGGTTIPDDDVLYRGRGDGTFERVDLPEQTNPLTVETSPQFATAGRAAYGLAVADYDLDGDLDIFVNNYGAGRPAAGSAPRYWDHNLLWRNDGDMRFTDVGAEAGVAATLRGIGGVEAEARLLFDGRFWPQPIGGNGFGCQFADFDNDGDLDLVVGTIAHPDYRQSDRTMLHVNQGPPDFVFTEESAARGLEYYEDELHPVMVDVDLDGRLDLAMSRLRGGSKWRLYFQTEDGRFAMQSVADSGVDVTRPGPTLWLDADGDGDLDFVMPKGRPRFFENLAGAGRRHLQISLQGRASDPTGARVVVESSAGTQTRVLASGEGHYNTQQSRVLAFGLGGDSGASEVRIHWPSGAVDALGPVRADHHLLVREGGEVTVLRAPAGE